MSSPAARLASGAGRRRFSICCRSGILVLAALAFGGPAGHAPQAQMLAPEPLPPVSCGREIPVEWCGDRGLGRPDAFVSFRLADEDLRPGGMSFYTQGDGLVFHVYLDRLAEGDYKIVLDEARGCEAYDPQVVARDRAAAVLRVRGELNLSALYPGANGTTRASGEVFGLALTGGALPIAGMTALVVRGGDLTETVVAAGAVVACGHIRLNR